MLKALRQILDYRELLQLLIRQNLVLRYHGSVLGFAWTLLFPLATVGVLSFVFAAVNNLPLAEYGVYFFSGYAFWMVFNNACLYAAESIVGNPHFVTGVRVPKILLPLVTVAVNLLDLVITLFILVLLMMAWGRPLPATLAFLPVSLLIASTLITACSILCAVANVYFRDFRYLLNTGMFLWFFLSPILWKVEKVNASTQAIAQWNPIVPFLLLFQEPIWKGALPSAGVVLATAAGSFCLLFLATGVFMKAEKRFYYYL